MLLASLGTNIANVALPTLAQAFGATFQQVQWVVIAYMLAMTTLVVSAGRLADMVGRKRLMLAAIGVVTTGVLLSGLAPSLWLLTAARALQGLGAAIVIALAMALAGDAVPPSRTGRAMGVLATMSAVGTALGPTLAGLLIAVSGWRAVFLVTVPLGIATLLLVRRFLPADRPLQRASGERFDYFGTLLLAATLTAYALALTVGQGRFGGLNLLLLLAAFVGLAAFIAVQARSRSPLLKLSAFRQPVLSGGFAMSVIVMATMTGTLIVGPFYLAGGLGLDTVSLGLVVSTGPVVAALSGMPSGRAVDRFGARWAMLSGLAFLIAGNLLVPLLSRPFGIPGYIAASVVFTIGYALFQAANNTSVMMTARAEDRGVVAGTLTLSRNLGQATGASLLGMVFAAGAGAADFTGASAQAVTAGMSAAFFTSAALLCVAFLIAWATLNAARGQARTG